MQLIVSRDFPGHARGDVVTGDAQVAEITSGPYRDHVVRVTSPPSAAEVAVEKAEAALAAAEAALHPAS